jgi:hypothetical protein
MPFRPIRVNNAIPETVGGITSGAMTIGRIHLVLASGPRAKYQASGTPKKTEITAEIIEVTTETSKANWTLAEIAISKNELHGTLVSSAKTGKTRTRNPTSASNANPGFSFELSCGLLVWWCIEACRDQNILA